MGCVGLGGEGYLFLGGGGAAWVGQTLGIGQVSPDHGMRVSVSFFLVSQVSVKTWSHKSLANMWSHYILANDMQIALAQNVNGGQKNLNFCNKVIQIL